MDEKHETYMQVVDEYPTHSIYVIAETLVYGKQKGHQFNSWRKVQIIEHIFASIGHWISYLRGKTDEEHHKCALTRSAMAVDLIVRGGNDVKTTPQT